MAGDGEAALLKGLLLEKEGESIGPGTLEEGGRFNSRPTGARSRPAGAAASAKKAIEDGKLLAPSHPVRFVVYLGGPPCRSYSPSS